MKTLNVLAIWFVTISVVLGQEVQVDTTKSAVEKSNETELAVPEAPKADSDLLRKQVTYSGFLVDVARTNSPFRLLSLRSPVDLKRDARNLVFEPVTGRAVGFKLFSIDF